MIVPAVFKLIFVILYRPLAQLALVEACERLPIKQLFKLLIGIIEPISSVKELLFKGWAELNSKQELLAIREPIHILFLMRDDVFMYIIER